MHTEPVDERDSCWEDPRPRFRVYIYRGGDEPLRSWSTATDDVTDAGVLEVVDWAREQAGADGLYAVALVVDDRARPQGRRRGLVWLVGDDVPNASAPTEREQHVFEGMLARRARYR